MTEYVLDGAPATASGHPGVCTPTFSGTVEGSTPVTYNGEPIATQSGGTIEFESHGHDTETDDDGNEFCVDFQSHSIVPDNVSESVSYNGSGLFIVTDDADTDPGSGGSIDITGSGGNSAVTE